MTLTHLHLQRFRTEFIVQFISKKSTREYTLVWRHGGRSGRAGFEARAPLEPCLTQGSGLATSTNARHPFRAADAAGWRPAHGSTAR